MGTATGIKHPVPDRIKSSFVIFDIRGARTSKITNDGFAWSGCTHMATVDVKGWKMFTYVFENSDVCLCVKWDLSKAVLLVGVGQSEWWVDGSGMVAALVTWWIVSWLSCWLRSMAWLNWKISRCSRQPIDLISSTRSLAASWQIVTWNKPLKTPVTCRVVSVRTWKNWSNETRLHCVSKKATSLKSFIWHAVYPSVRANFWSNLVFFDEFHVYKWQWRHRWHKIDISK